MVGIHSGFYKGSKIRVIWSDGTQLITKFIDRLGQDKIKTAAGILNLKDMRSCNYYKPLQHERN